MFPRIKLVLIFYHNLLIFKLTVIAGGPCVYNSYALKLIEAK
jgi:hypothetical protein